MNRYGNETVIPRKSDRRAKRTYAPKYKSTDSDIKELHGLTGGQKYLWLGVHRDEVLTYLQAHGDAETRRYYGLTTHRVLDDLKTRWFVESRHRSVSAFDRLRTDVDIIATDNANLRKEIRELKEQYSILRESIGEQLATKFFIPLLRLAIKLDDPKLDLPEKPFDPLNVQYLLEHTQRRTKKEG